MKSSSNLVSALVLGASMLTLVTACGNHSSSNKQHQAQEVNAVQADMLPVGKYKAILAPINGIAAPKARGEVKISRSDDQFSAVITVSGVSAGAHAQALHLATACPTEKMDVNADGFIDVKEAALGDMVVAFDNNLNTLVDGAENYPVADAYGSYKYSERGSFQRMVDDIHGAGKKVVPAEGRVVVIYGVNEATKLPATVAKLADKTSHASLPVACGKLMKVDSVECKDKACN